MLRKYKIGFDFRGLILFLIIMIPNFIWFIIPAPNDILRGDSVTPHIDMIASICQVLMILFLCIFIRRENNEVKSAKWISLVTICCILYYSCWICYYIGITNLLVAIGLTIPPCLAFLFFAIYRKNTIAILPATIFSLCHLIYAILNLRR